MPPPLIGDWIVNVASVRPFTIHGDLYFELHVFEPNSAGPMTAVRVPQHAIAGEPREGDQIRLTFLMGQVTTAKREPNL
jgi:hypothetical protein